MELCGIKINLVISWETFSFMLFTDQTMLSIYTSYLKSLGGKDEECNRTWFHSV